MFALEIPLLSDIGLVAKCKIENDEERSKNGGHEGLEQLESRHPFHLRAWCPFVPSLLT